MNFRKSREKLKNLEKALDWSNVTLFSSTLLADLTKSIKLFSSSPIQSPSGEIYFHEKNPFIDPFISQYGPVYGTIYGFALQASVILGISAGFYLMNFASEGELKIFGKKIEADKLNRIHYFKKFNHMPILRRIPAYALLLYGSYLNLSGIFSYV